MSNVITFTPKFDTDSKKNFNDFIAFVENKLPLLNDKYEYSDTHWSGVGNFTKFGVSSKSRSADDLLDSTILTFGKAYVTYEQTIKRTHNANQLYALRAIEAACVAKSKAVDVTKLGVRDFDNAALIARDMVSVGVAYQAGAALANLHKFLTQKKMIKPFVWKNPNSKAKDINTVGVEGDKRRQDKMPDDNALIAIAEISVNKVNELSHRDIFTTSTMAIMLSAPERGSELMYLKTGCVHKEKMTVKRAIECGFTIDELNELVKQREEVKKNANNNEIVINGEQSTAVSIINSDEPLNEGLKDTDSITLYGLLWFSGKGFGYANKWLPTVMTDVALRSIKRLREQSKKARAFAKQLEDSTSFPRHPLCPDVADDVLLTKTQAVAALGLDTSAMATKQASTSGNQILKKNGIERKDFQVTLSDLNKIVRGNLPDGFPFIPFKTGQDQVEVLWSEGLYVMFANQLDTRKSTIFTELSIPTINTLNEDLAPTKKKNRVTGELSAGSLSIFQRWNYGELEMTSHQTRHLLDTMAAVNGMEGVVRAKWAQRADAKNNKYYDHTNSAQYTDNLLQYQEYQNEIAEVKKVESLGVKWQIATPRTIQELNTQTHLTAHLTDFGMCLRSYISEPCEKYRDCINCTEHVCKKGDDGKCDRIRDRLKREEHLLRKAQRDVDNGVSGSEQWHQRRSLTVSRCKELLDMLTNPDISDGALIKLADIEDISLLDRTMDANGKKRLPKIKNYQRKNIENVSVDELVGIQIVDKSEEMADFNTSGMTSLFSFDFDDEE